MTERLKLDPAVADAIWGGVTEQMVNDHAAKRTKVTVGPELNGEDKQILRGYMGFLSDGEFHAFVEAVENPPSTPAEISRAYELRPSSLAGIMRDMR